MLEQIFDWYLCMVEKTCKMEIEQDALLEGERSVLGFWHGDSCAMNLLLRRIQKKGRSAEVIVTADKRGNVIEYLIQKRGGRAIRMNDGVGIRTGLRQLEADAHSEVNWLGCALDGPLGPEYQAKKLAFYLAEEAGRKVVCCHVAYSYYLSLFWRWDHYAVPLPFTRIKVKLFDLGEIDRNRLRSFHQWSHTAFQPIAMPRKQARSDRM